ncbi:MAG: YqeG family HAD IIIA-type phosphatase [Ruminococcaceae bacterium]|nr:YqeG family HAD IIIA-type phosphatase [Oscillospiraceae bacterium]
MFFPKEFKSGVSGIDLETLWKNGKRGILCDIDNTLCRDEQFYIEPQSAEFIRRAKELGFKICLMSNNGNSRVEPVASELSLPYNAKSGKPKAAAYLNSLKKIDVPLENAVMVGDQLFTDILGANLIGLYSILVKPIDKKEILQIRLKRPFEKIILFFYKITH